MLTVMIVLFFVGVGTLIYIYCRLNQVSKRFETRIRQIQTKGQSSTGIMDDGTVYNVSAQKVVVHNRDELEDAREEYNKHMPWYNAVSQAISVFPLLGILGTVWGLRNGSITDINSLISGFGFALDTTIVGLGSAIILKVIDYFIVGSLVYKLEQEFYTADLAIERETLKRDKEGSSYNETETTY